MITFIRKKPLVVAGLVIGLGLGGWLASRVLVQMVSSPPENLGVKEGQLAPCPETPNCVSSQATDPEHQIAPISYSGSTAEAKARLMDILTAMPRLTIVAELPDYVYAETRTPGFGFVDDNEFYFDETAGVIHVRAAARLGQSDMGANRQRIEEIRFKFMEAATP